MCSAVLAFFSGGCKQPNLSTGAGRLYVFACKVKKFLSNIKNKNA